VLDNIIRNGNVDNGLTVASWISVTKRRTR